MLRRPLLRTASTKGGVDPSMYLHRSILPSYYFQDSLPSLPIPTLDVTLQRYLRSLSPLITPEALARTTAIVKDFQGGDGLRLNAKLHENVLANPHTSYISEDWFDMYLTTRCVCFCSSFFLLLVFAAAAAAAAAAYATQCLIVILLARSALLFTVILLY